MKWHLFGEYDTAIQQKIPLKGSRFIESRRKTPQIDCTALKGTSQEDVSGVEVSLISARKENGLLVIFSCNTCPFVLGWEDRYIPVGEWCAANNVGFVLVNSNEAQRDKQDSMEEMKKHAADKNYNTFYVVDTDHVLADAFGATRTPEVFLFDEELSLVYQGAIDDNMEDASTVEKPYLENALMNLLNSMPIDPATTKSVGCTIKRVKK